MLLDRLLASVLASLVASGAGCASTPAPNGAETPQVAKSDLTPSYSEASPSVATPTAPRLESSGDVEFSALRGPVWVHTSWAVVEPWGRVPANGLVVLAKSEALLIDTPWNDSQTEQVFREVKRAFGVPVTKVIVTHAHDDNMGGLSAAHRLGAMSYAGDLTVELAKAAGRAVPQVGFAGELRLTVAGVSVELYYPGPGHTRDNIVVYLPDWDILFGGCLIKDARAKSLGNTADADIPRWADSVRAVERRFPSAAVVVPGHGISGDRSILTHTTGLAEAAR